MLPRRCSGFDLDETLGRLSPEHRAVVVLHYVEGYKVREIAGMLGIPTGTVKTAPDDRAGPYSEKSGSLSARKKEDSVMKKREYAEAVERWHSSNAPGLSSGHEPDAGGHRGAGPRAGAGRQGPSSPFPRGGAPGASACLWAALLLIDHRGGGRHPLEPL